MKNTFAPCFILPLLVACSVSQSSSPGELTGPIKTISRSNSCIELNVLGEKKEKLNSRLIQAAIDDAKDSKFPLSFHKAVASPDSDDLLYVFDSSRITDTYWVYVVDKDQTKIIGKFVYGSLYYPCSTTP